MPRKPRVGGMLLERIRRKRSIPKDLGASGETRSFGGLALVLGWFLLVAAGGGVAMASETREATGPAGAQQDVDQVMLQLLAEWQVPGGALAIARNGRLVHSGGYGLADLESGNPVQADAVFRIASISKPITATAIMTLVQQGRLDLDDRAFALLGYLGAPDSVADARVHTITVRHLLQHSGGWDRQQSFDPLFASRRIAVSMRAPEPATCETTARFMLHEALQFDPGTRSAYSNLGFCLLSLVIERVSGQSYEDYVQGQVHAPAGIREMRTGRTRLSEQDPREVRYYQDGTALSVFPGEGNVLNPYGRISIEAQQGGGNWTASAVDLARFATALDGRRGIHLLNEQSLALVGARPAFADPNVEGWYGLGWNVRQSSQTTVWWHHGACGGAGFGICGTLRQGTDGLTWVALFNKDVRDTRFLGSVDRAILDFARSRTMWPEHDLFASQAPATPTVGSAH